MKDDLDAAKGIFNALVLSLIIWGIIVWIGRSILQ